MEGVRIFGKPVLKGPPGWISVFPDSGTTTRETDYVNIVLNTRQLTPGIYGEHVFFTSNGGEADVEVFLEVAAETQSRFLDVYRYLAGSDYLYTTNPQAEASRLQVKGYRHLGIAFRLFSPGNAGDDRFFPLVQPGQGRPFLLLGSFRGRKAAGRLSLRRVHRQHRHLPSGGNPGALSLV